MKPAKFFAISAATGLLAIGVAACGSGDSTDGTDGGTATGLSGTIRIDGSSTVAPLTEAVAEGFQQENPDVRVTVGTSGTGGGFEKFCAGETDFSDASRAIEPEEEKLCEDGGVDWEEVRVATDALTVVVNPENPVTCMTVDQLADVWGPDTTATTWNDIPDLDASFDADLARYGPGTDSGTFDHFTEAVNGEEGASTKDYNNVGEDDNATVSGVSGDSGGIGYFGYSFFAENEDEVKALELDGGDGCVAPSVETAQDGSYTPLSRPLFIYPTGSSLDDPTKQAFIDYYLANVSAVAESLGFIPLTDAQLSASEDALANLEGK
ncbi:MAG: PstS family phosphate ABC transporter substrate-binding protein [Thermoleophilia bacterium]|nr:PstS family phosphate ABC transporter substrate-binding protein [Thermoleophilia bacterium]